MPTKVYFSLSSLAGESRHNIQNELNGNTQLSVCMKVAVFLSFNFLKRKYNARDFNKSKSANLLKILKGEHLTKKSQNCGTEVLCVMLYYDGAEFARNVDKVLGKTKINLTNFHVPFRGLEWK